ncbi:MAG: hypothetical protein IT458_12435 [Planctomycetes bacterium]|nr:hypothetical protein [Planctomycetota bacterium]
MRRAALLLGLLCAACHDAPRAEPAPARAPAAPLELRAAADRDEVPLLAPFTLVLDLYLRDGLAAEFAPAIPEGFAGTVEPRPARRAEGGTWRRSVLRLRALATGERTIPPFMVRAGDGSEARSAAIGLRVTSLVSAEDAALEDPGPPFPPRTDLLPWIGAAAGAAALAAAAWWWWRRRRVVVPAPPAATPLAPHLAALRALARLRQQPRRTPAEVEAFYVEVSRILRGYLEQRFGLRAPERTTEEFLAEAERSPVLLAGQRGELRLFLQQCDLVKFARLLPGADTHERTFALAEAFVEATRADRVHEGAA